MGGGAEDLLHARHTVFRRREELSDSKAAFAKVAVLKSPFSGDFPTKATEGQERLCGGAFDFLSEPLSVALRRPARLFPAS